MNLFNKDFTNGHIFCEENNLEEFRFTLLNILLHAISFFITIYYIITFFGLFTIDQFFGNIILIYMITLYLALWFLKKDKKYYFMVSNIVIMSSVILLFVALIVMVNDEFRLVWFLLSVFIAFILMGQTYGLVLMVVIMLGVLISFASVELELSNLAIYHFYNSFLLFGTFAFFFFKKIEKDEKEFKRLYLALSERISDEVKEREDQKKILLRQCRLVNMGEMIDSIAHQWRQPLMNINAILMNMERGLETKENPKRFLEGKIDEVTTLTNHLSQTIEDFRSLLQTNKKKSYFSIEQSIEHALGLYKSALKEVNVTKKEEYHGEFYGFKNELAQVIIILISNAIEALQSHQPNEKQLFITSILDHHQLTITVTDNAGGIDETLLHHIFDPYFTTKDQTGGTGLGLYISKIIIEQSMQGILHVSNTDEGAKFTITIPNIKEKE